MQLSTLAAALLLPLAALAQADANTTTATQIMTKTVYLSEVVATTTATRANNATVTAAPNSTVPMATGTGVTSVFLPTTSSTDSASSSSSTSAPISGAASLNGAYVGSAGIVAMVVAGFL